MKRRAAEVLGFCWFRYPQMRHGNALLVAILAGAELVSAGVAWLSMISCVRAPQQYHDVADRDLRVICESRLGELDCCSVVGGNCWQVSTGIV